MVLSYEMMSNLSTYNSYKFFIFHFCSVWCITVVIVSVCQTIWYTMGHGIWDIFICTKYYHVMKKRAAMLFCFESHGSVPVCNLLWRGDLDRPSPWNTHIWDAVIAISMMMIHTSYDTWKTSIRRNKMLQINLIESQNSTPSTLCWYCVPKLTIAFCIL